MVVRLTPTSLDDGMPMNAWQRRRNLDAAGLTALADPDSGFALPRVSDDMAMADWQRARAMQVLGGDVISAGAGDDKLAGGAGSDTLSVPSKARARPTLRPGQIGSPRLAEFDGDIAAGQALGGLVQDAERAVATTGRAIRYRLKGQGPEAPSSANAAARWAESRVGTDGYDFLDTAPNARGRRDEILGRLGLRGVGDPKCNQFVYDALSASGAPPGRLDGGRIPLAEDWGNPRARIDGYQPVQGRPQRGDVVSDGHHVGIFAPLSDGRPGTVSAATPGSHDAGVIGGVVHNDWGFRKRQGPMTVWRRSP